MKLIKKHQKGGNVDNPTVINYFKNNPNLLGKFATQMQSQPQDTFKMLTDNKQGKFHQNSYDFIKNNLVPPTAQRADSLDYVNPRNHIITPTNSIDFAKRFPNKTYKDLDAQRLGLSNLSTYKNSHGQPITQSQYKLDFANYNILKNLLPNK